MNFLKKITLAITGLILWNTGSAQNKQIIEEVIGIVGENVIFKSELDKEVFQMQQQYTEYDGDPKCEIFNQLVLQKLLIHKADMDSIVIADDRLDYEINRRIEFYAQQAGSLERLEQYLGMSILEYKDRMREKVRNQMKAEQAKDALLSDVKVSPTEVRKFFSEIPEDSLPAFNSEVEIGQIVVKPKPNQLAKDFARRRANEIRNEILNGEIDFCTAALLYSADKSNSDQCGSLGEFKRGTMVPEFETAAFRLKKDSVSEVVETEFGFHIIKLLERKGNILNAEHILIQPKILSSDLQAAQDSLKLALELIKSGVDFCDVVNRFSEDETTKANCGFYTDPSLGTNKIEVNYLPSDIALRIEKLNSGDFSPIHGIQLPSGETAFRVLYLKSEIPPHEADLRDDYQKLSVFALEKKKQDLLKDWMQKYKQETYVWFDEKYVDCADSLNQ